ncbi:MAG: HAMP domain-containing protein [Anaerolineae bacterium]|nr:HAMP domain-containing protein [Anaerolineae bacterium]
MRRFRRLAARFTFGFFLVVLLSALGTALSALLFIYNEVNRQTWEHVFNGQRATLALIEARHGQLANLVLLASERPTLRTLIEKDDAASLNRYLLEFREQSDVDFLLVCDGGTWLAGDTYPQFCAARNQTVNNSGGSIALLATHVSGMAGTREPLALVAGVWIDDTFMRGLALETGYEQSLLAPDKALLVSSLSPQASTLIREPVRVPRALRDTEFVTVDLSDTRRRYYASQAPLIDAAGQPLAYSEVALPVNNLLNANYRSLLVMVGSAGLFTLIGVLVGWGLSRTLTRPIARLTWAAVRLSQGDLSEPIPVIEDPDEINTLARVLEESRVNISRSLSSLSQARQWSEGLMQSIVEGVVTFDTGGQITFFNRGAEQITGFSAAEVLHLPLEQVFRLRQGGEQMFADLIPPRDSMRLIEVLTRSGRPVRLAVTGARMQPPRGQDTQVALVFRDVTEEETVRELRAHFLATITHEFRTPLSALNASIELLHDEADTLSPDELRELTGSISLGTLNLQNLINNLLESTSVEAGRFTIRKSRVDMAEIVHEAVRVMGPLLRRRGQRVDISITEGLPALEADPVRLTQVFVNLLSNASKYGPADAGIRIEVVAQDEQVQVDVIDHGPGVAPEDMQHLFKPFTRVGKGDEAQHGIGLGLSVVKAIVGEHDGTVSCERPAEGGCCFRVCLPLGEGE